MPFADSFALTRDRFAAYRDAAGVLQLADPDAPRFDHSVAGEPLGLLVEGRPQTRLADRLTVQAGPWATGKITVLHAYTTPAGELRRRAAYVTEDHVAAVDGFLMVKGWHREVAVVAGFLANRGGFVRWRRIDWALGALVSAGPGAVVGVTPDIVLLES